MQHAEDVGPLKVAIHRDRRLHGLRPGNRVQWQAMAMQMPSWVTGIALRAMTCSLVGILRAEDAVHLDLVGT